MQSMTDAVCGEKTKLDRERERILTAGNICLLSDSLKPQQQRATAGRGEDGVTDDRAGDR